MEEGARRDVAAMLAQVPKPATLRIKVISMGSEGVGKSCIIKRYCEERFVPKYISTIGIDYGVKKVIADGNEARVNFWDLAGAAEYLEIRNEFYKDAQCAILVYDVTSLRSFQALDDFLKESARFGAKDLVIAVCANKCDLPKRVISEADGKKWATARGYSYFDTSASTGQNINAMFDQLFSDTMMLRRT